jgi:hypothetical protein
MPSVLTRGEVATQLDTIRAKASEACAGLSEAQLNWQPDGGRRWSIAQCLDHLARTTRLYGQRLDEAIDAAPAGDEQREAHPNMAGRILIWAMEPPNRLRTRTQRALQPPSTLSPDDVRRAFGDSLDYLATLTARALHVDASRLRYRNPLAGNTRFFNLATGILVMLAHDRRHLEQALRVRRHKDFPKS